jgi:hypothetical protein
MPGYSQYAAYASAILRRDNLIGFVGLMSIVLLLSGFLFRRAFPKIKIEWVWVGVLYATLALVVFVPR